MSSKACPRFSLSVRPPRPLHPAVPQICFEELQPLFGQHFSRVSGRQLYTFRMGPKADKMLIGMLKVKYSHKFCPEYMWFVVGSCLICHWRTLYKQEAIQGRQFPLPLTWSFKAWERDSYNQRPTWLQIKKEIWRWGYFLGEGFLLTQFLKGNRTHRGSLRMRERHSIRKSRATAWLCSFLPPKEKGKVFPCGGVWSASLWIPGVPTTVVNKPFLIYLQQYANWWMKLHLMQATSEQMWVCRKITSE